MAIVVRSDHSKTVSLLNLDRWSRKLRDIQMEKLDERHKFLILINAYIHPSTCITGASCDFLEEMEDKLGDTIMICGDFNTRPSLRDQHGTNQQGRALEAYVSFPRKRRPPPLQCGLESRLGLELSGFSTWHILQLVVGGFLLELWFPPPPSLVNGFTR